MKTFKTETIWLGFLLIRKVKAVLICVHRCVTKCVTAIVLVVLTAIAAAHMMVIMKAIVMATKVVMKMVQVTRMKKIIVACAIHVDVLSKTIGRIKPSQS